MNLVMSVMTHVMMNDRRAIIHIYISPPTSPYTMVWSATSLGGLLPYWSYGKEIGGSPL